MQRNGRSITARLGALAAAMLMAAVPGTAARAIVSASAPVTFTHEIAVDPQRLGSEPAVAIDSAGAIYTTAIWGFSNTNTFLYKSEDGGAQYDLIRGCFIAAEQRPFCSRGGGDVDIHTGKPHASGQPPALYYADLNDLETLTCAYSYDGANTMHVSGSGIDPLAEGQVCNLAAGNGAGSDRQWFAVDSRAQSDVVYLYYNSVVSGLSLLKSTDAGQNYALASNNIAADFGRPGPMVVDQNNGNIYAFITTSHGSTSGVSMIASHDGGSTFAEYPVLATASETGDSNNNDFLGGAVDTAGNLYAVWTTANANDPTKPQVLYYAYSTDQADQYGVRGKRWSAPIAITGQVGSPAPAITATNFPWITAGDPGRVDIAFYGSTKGLPFNPNSTAADWDVYLAQSISARAASPGPTFSVTKATEQPIHRGSICNAGLGCSAGGNRNLGDFFEVQSDPQGRAVIITCDTNNSAVAVVSGGCISNVIEQAGGPSLLTDPGIITGPPPSLSQSLDIRTGVTDPSGDARLPAHGASIGANVDAADITSVHLGPKDANTLQVRMTVKDLHDPTAAIVGSHTSATWMVMWHQGNDVWFGAASIDNSGSPQFYAGRAANVPNSGAPKAFVYAQDPARNQPVSGRFDSASKQVEIDVPSSAVGNIKDTDILYSVQGFTYDGSGFQGGNAPLMDQIDASAPFDYRHAGVNPPPPPSAQGPGAAQRAMPNTTRPAGLLWMAASVALVVVFLAVLEWRVGRRRA